MTIQLKCPSCEQTLYFSRVDETKNDASEGICPGCRYQYKLVSAQVLAFASRVETSHSAKYHKQPSLHRIYELRLAVTNNGIKACAASVRMKFPPEVGEVEGIEDL